MARVYVPRSEVVTSNYEFTHGRRPAGYGSWAFGPQKSSRLEDMFWVNNAYYQHAKKQAIAWGTAKGYDVIYPQT